MDYTINFLPAPPLAFFPSVGTPATAGTHVVRLERLICSLTFVTFAQESPLFPCSNSSPMKLRTTAYLFGALDRSSPAVVVLLDWAGRLAYMW